MIGRMVLLLLLMCSGSWAADSTVLVTTVPARQGDLPRTLAAFGTVDAAPDGVRSMSLLRAGQVAAVFVAVGQTVREGDKLLEVTANPASVSAYNQAVAAVNLAQGERGRAQQLLSQHLGTRDQLAMAEKSLADAQANVEALRRAGGGTASDTVTAPFDGFVTALAVTQGQRFQADTALLVLTRAGRLAVSAGIEPAARADVKVGQPVTLQSLDGAGSATSSIASVGAMVDPQTHFVPALIALPSSGLLPGSPVRANIEIGRMKGWIVPRLAVLTDAKGPYVFQVAGEKAARIDVRVVGTAGDSTVVDGQIDPMRTIVASGNYQLQDGGAVREASPASDQAAQNPEASGSAQP